MAQEEPPEDSHLLDPGFTESALNFFFVTSSELIELLRFTHYIGKSDVPTYVVDALEDQQEAIDSDFDSDVLHQVTVLGIDAQRHEPLIPLLFGCSFGVASDNVGDVAFVAHAPEKWIENSLFPVEPHDFARIMHDDMPYEAEDLGILTVEGWVNPSTED